LLSFINSAFVKEKTSFLLPLLIHEGSSQKKAADDRGGVSVFMDIPDWKEYPVAHKETIERINEQFLKITTAIRGEPHNRKDDAFGGDSNGSEEKLPDVKLPYIGKVKLRAMNSESPVNIDMELSMPNLFALVQKAGGCPKARWNG